MSSDTPFREWAWGADAARIFGVAEASSVWRAIARHGGEYPGELEVVQMGNRKMVRRDQLEAFTSWFAAGPGRLDKRIKIGIGVGQSEPQAAEPPAPDVKPAADMAARRARLARQIARLTGV